MAAPVPAEYRPASPSSLPDLLGIVCGYFDSPQTIPGFASAYPLLINRATRPRLPPTMHPPEGYAQDSGPPTTNNNNLNSILMLLIHPSTVENSMEAIARTDGKAIVGNGLDSLDDLHPRKSVPGRNGACSALTPQGAVNRIALPHKGAIQHREKNVSAQQHQTETPARLSSPHVYQGRASHHQCASGQGPQAAHGLTRRCLRPTERRSSGANSIHSTTLVPEQEAWQSLLQPVPDRPSSYPSRPRSPVAARDLRFPKTIPPEPAQRI